MDISSITASSSTIEIRHPATGEPLGLRITLRPTSSTEVQTVKRRITNESIRMRNKNISAEKLEANGLDILVAMIENMEWEGDTSWHGEKLDATPANIRKLMKEADWIKKQVDDAIGDDAAFFQS